MDNHIVFFWIFFFSRMLLRDCQFVNFLLSLRAWHVRKTQIFTIIIQKWLFHSKTIQKHFYCVQLRSFTASGSNLIVSSIKSYHIFRPNSLSLSLFACMYIYFCVSFISNKKEFTHATVKGSPERVINFPTHWKISKDADFSLPVFTFFYAQCFAFHSGTLSSSSSSISNMFCIRQAAAHCPDSKTATSHEYAGKEKLSSFERARTATLNNNSIHLPFPSPSLSLSLFINIKKCAFCTNKNTLSILANYHRHTCPRTHWK